ncbi:tRNA (adenosine(37)-N6)-threonylcarbamoyltransferase complex ATPase subunit type 1 TsaE [Flavobacterium sp. '19STA2R22 D10 B1']|uniref:tRNA (adenosine(37)-N6)-threonylcarbamoyltransferase complex ATPase subunit type 1 TsaE n=1 Tax=Flavobacterium aerium TaxID=3037261 RepID=UPI00278BB1F9|nr:tRNA (adenosine(37)-N6)-threonylcarbamoyltransferase complex ATPase subunit type 1 TsaE [Flavobacterium sp. '19STA2R22 D10 B1']
MEILFSLAEIDQVAQQIIASNPNKVIVFHGDMGVGKTTLIKALAKAFGVRGATSSPTFSLVNEYETENGDRIYHFDLYRLNKEEEAYDMGIDEYLYSDEWCFIEWPERIPNLIPTDHTTIKIKLASQGKRNLLLK